MPKEGRSLFKLLLCSLLLSGRLYLSQSPAAAVSLCWKPFIFWTACIQDLWIPILALLLLFFNRNMYFCFYFYFVFFLVTLHRIFLSLYTPFPSVFIIVGTRRQVLSFFCNISNLAISVSLLDIFKIFLLPSQTAV